MRRWLLVLVIAVVSSTASAEPRQAVPSLAVTAGGVLEFAHHGRNAWLVSPNSAPALTQGLRRLLQDAALRASLVEGGLQTARERGWDQVYDQLLEDYREVVESKRLIQAA